MTDPNTMGELDTIARMLDFYREAITWKLAGVNDAEARRPMVPSGTSLLGIVKHLAFTEREWFQKVIGGRDVFLPFDAHNPTAIGCSTTATPSVRWLPSTKQSAPPADRFLTRLRIQVR